jgi:hypothetical protein
MNDEGLAALVAKDSIRRLISLYCDAVSRRDPDALAPLFAPDASVKIADGVERVGRQEVVEGFRRTASGFSFLHQKCDTGLIDVDGRQARARHGVMELNVALGSDQLNMIFGTYEDEYRLLEEGWRFFRRRFTLQFRALLQADQLQHFGDVEGVYAFAP